MKKNIYRYAVLGFIFFQACGTQPYLKQNSAFIVLKTPTFRYADMGFIYENKEEVKVEIYGTGKALMRLQIRNNSICLSRFQCMQNTSFNRTVLNKNYPKNILNHIFRGEPIFQEKNKVINRNSFTQKIFTPYKYDIEYRVFNNSILFRDKINNIIIKVKKQ
jgi:hypothetical protein